MFVYHSGIFLESIDYFLTIIKKPNKNLKFRGSGRNKNVGVQFTSKH